MNLELSFLLSGNISDYKYTQKTIMEIFNHMPEEFMLVPKPIEIPIFENQNIKIENRISLFNENISIEFFPEKIEFYKAINNPNINVDAEKKEFLKNVKVIFQNLSVTSYFQNKKFERIAFLSVISSDDIEDMKNSIDNFEIIKDEKIESFERYLEREFIEEISEPINFITSISKQEDPEKEIIDIEFPKTYRFTKDINSVPYLFEERIDFNYIEKFLKVLNDN